MPNVLRKRKIVWLVIKSITSTNLKKQTLEQQLHERKKHQLFSKANFSRYMKKPTTTLSILKRYTINSSLTKENLVSAFFFQRLIFFKQSQLQQCHANYMGSVPPYLMIFLAKMFQENFLKHLLKLCGKIIWHESEKTQPVIRSRKEFIHLTSEICLWGEKMSF